MKEEIIIKMYSGSRLYGLNTPQSDTDIIGVFLPNEEDLILQNVENEYNINNSNTCISCLNNDGRIHPHCDYQKDKNNYIEEKYLSIHKFLKLCYNGNPMALELLASNPLNFIDNEKEEVYKIRELGLKVEELYKNDKNLNIYETLKILLNNTDFKICFSSYWSNESYNIIKLYYNNVVIFKFECDNIEDFIFELKYYHVHCLWKFLVKNRKKLFTKNLKEFLGYMNHQAHIYSRKGNRIKLLEDLINVFKNSNPVSVLTLTDNFFPKDDNDKDCILNKLQQEYTKNNIEYIKQYGTQNIPYFRVCGKYFPTTITVKELISKLENIKNRYGKRAEDAANNTADFKAISHAFRLCYELKEIITNNDLNFPFKSDLRDYILNIKLGKKTVNECYNELDRLIEEIETLIPKSEIPDEISQEIKDIFNNELLEVYIG